MKRVYSNLCLPEELAAAFRDRFSLEMPTPEKGMDLPAEVITFLQRMGQYVKMM